MATKIHPLAAVSAQSSDGYILHSLEIQGEQQLKIQEGKYKSGPVIEKFVGKSLIRTTR